MFHRVGTHKVRITEAFLGDAKFNQTPGVFDVILKVEDAEGNSDFWRGEWSNEFGKGNVSDKTQFEMTQSTLNKLGMPGGIFDQGVIQSDANDVPIIPCLIGIETEVDISETISKSNGKTYYNIKHIGTSYAPKPISFTGLMGQLGGAPAPVATTPAPPVTGAPAQSTIPAPVSAPMTAAAPAPAPATTAHGGIPPFPTPTAAPAPVAANGAFANLATPPQG